MNRQLLQAVPFHFHWQMLWHALFSEIWGWLLFKMGRDGSENALQVIMEGRRFSTVMCEGLGSAYEGHALSPQQELVLECSGLQVFVHDVSS